MLWKIVSEKVKLFNFTIVFIGLYILIDLFCSISVKKLEDYYWITDDNENKRFYK